MARPPPVGNDAAPLGAWSVRPPARPRSVPDRAARTDLPHPV